MFSGQLVLSQLMELLPRHEFNACVRRYRGDHRCRELRCRDQFLCMAFAQLTFRESLRDLETCLQSLGPKLYHAGFRGRISRSTLADANRNRDWRIYGDLAQVLIARARTLYVRAFPPFAAVASALSSRRNWNRSLWTGMAVCNRRIDRNRGGVVSAD